jgi:HemY protein
MQRFIIFLIILVGSIFLGWKISEDPGLAFFSYKQWSAEMPLWFAVLSAIIIFYLGYILLRVMNGMGFSLYRWRNWRKWRRKYKSYSKTNQGLVELIEGNWNNAEYYLLEGVTQSDAPLVNYLAAAYAADQRGGYERRDAFLLKAHAIAPQAEIAIGLTQAQLQLKHGELEQALATLDHLRKIAPNQKLVLKLLERVYVRLADWPELLKLLPTLRKKKLITAEEQQNFENHIYLEMLSGTTPETLPAVWEGVPKKLRQQPVLLSGYAKKLPLESAQADALEKLLNSTLKTSWNKELVKTYGLLPGSDPVKQLAKAEKWLPEHNTDATLYLTLGLLSMRCQLWGKAKNYLETSLNLEPDPETYAAYGKLLESLGDQKAALSSYRDGIELAGSRRLSALPLTTRQN